MDVKSKSHWFLTYFPVIFQLVPELGPMRFLPASRKQTGEILTGIYIYIYIYEEESSYNKLLQPFSTFSKSKSSIQTVRCDIYNEICLETKFYMFWNIFTIY